MDKTTREIRYQQWFERIQDWAQSGMPKTRYCEEHGISVKTFFYYQRRIRIQLASQLSQGPELPNGIENCGLLPGEASARPQIVKLDITGQRFTPQANTAGTVHFSVNGMAFEVEENINSAFLDKLIRASANVPC